MAELPRVPLVRKITWIGDEDVSVAIQPPIGRRISMDVSEEVIAQFGARVVESALEQLGKTLPNLYAGEIQSAVDKLLFDFSWLKPIIENEIRRTTREFILSLWSDDEKKAQRDWFDLLTASCLKRDGETP